MAPVIMGTPDRPELGEELTRRFCRSDPDLAARFARVTFLSDSRADLAGVGVPTLVLQCSDDAIAARSRGVRASRDRRLDPGPGRRGRTLSQPECPDGDDRRDPRVRLNSAWALPSTGPAPTGAPRVIAHQGDSVPDELRDSPSEPEFDKGDGGDRGAMVRLPLGRAPAPQRFSGWRSMTRRFEPDERAFLLACAEQSALALERARLYEKQRDVALTFQRSLVAGDPPDQRFEVATLYHPAVEHLEVGGDWHDAFALSGGRVGVVVGDVVGRGLGAATAMGQLRSAVRALAGAGLEPATVFAHFDTFVDQVETAR
jgi:hypothetical protein